MKTDRLIEIIGATIGLFGLAGASMNCASHDDAGPATCEEAKSAYGVSVDGPQILYVGGDKTMPWSAYCVGMALFTALMGNAFAAFPVMTAAVGLPVVVQRFGGDPAAVCAIGMLAGFCGTLTTPMAANFNVVPANLLELPDRKAALNSVIRTQMPTAFPLLVANILLMRFLAFR